MHKQKSSLIIRQLNRVVKKLKSKLHSTRVHSKNVKQRCFGLFDNNRIMSLQRFQEDDEQINKQYRRTISYASEDDDIDKKAEIFIANFRRQLRLERRVSFELQYC